MSGYISEWDRVTGVCMRVMGVYISMLVPAMYIDVGTGKDRPKLDRIKL